MVTKYYEEFRRHGSYCHWNLSSVFEIEDIYDCRLQISFYSIGNRANVYFFGKSNIKFAEFVGIKINEKKFFEDHTHNNQRIEIKTSNFKKEELILFLLSLKGGNERINSKFEQFVCNWL
jgi:hypothetical protein